MRDCLLRFGLFSHKVFSRLFCAAHYRLRAVLESIVIVDLTVIEIVDGEIRHDRKRNGTLDCIICAVEIETMRNIKMLHLPRPDQCSVVYVL